MDRVDSAKGVGDNLGMIMHVPWKLQPVQSASQLRPRQMQAAFEQLGFQVAFVSGEGARRRRRLREIKADLRAGKTFTFCYSESSVLPTLLASGRQSILSAALVDYRLLLLLKRYHIPVGVFLRDVYWRFPEFKAVYRSILRRWIYRLGYVLDLIVYSLFIDVLFLPSLEMAAHLPKWATAARTVELPPGLSSATLETRAGFSFGSSDGASPKSISLIYVGGLGYLYRIHALLQAVRRSGSSVTLTLVVRKADWERTKHEYLGEIAGCENIIVTHHGRDELPAVYAGHDIGVLFVEPSVYRTFAMPYKLFEYLGYGLPIIATAGTAVGDFVEHLDVGWAIPYDVAALESLVYQVATSPRTIQSKKAKIWEINHLHTWKARAETVETALSGARK